MKIGKIAKNVGITVETIRFYEKEGLLKAPPRSSSGYRDYPDEVLQDVSFIKRAKELGFSLKEIKELISLQNSPVDGCQVVKRQAEAKISSINRKVEDLLAIKRSLAKLASACPGQGPLSECPIIGSIKNNQLLRKQNE